MTTQTVEMVPRPTMEALREIALTVMGDTRLPAHRIRAQIQALEDALMQVPGALFGDNDLCPVTHHWTDGLYLREIFIPKGTVLTGAIHHYAHPNVLLYGEVVVVTEGRGREHLIAPRMLLSAAGTKRAVVALEDTCWITIHANPDEARDTVGLRAMLVSETPRDYAAFLEAQQEEEP